MTQWHMKSTTKVSGGTRTTFRRSDKRLAWKGNDPTLTTIAPSEEDIQRQEVAGLGNTGKVRLRLEKYVVVTEKGKSIKMEILSVVENNADNQFARRNIITKGAILKASNNGEEVFVKVTSRPGQSGTVSGIVIKEYTQRKEEKTSAKKEKKKPKAASKAEKKAQ